MASDFSRGIWTTSARPAPAAATTAVKSATRTRVRSRRPVVPRLLFDIRNRVALERQVDPLPLLNQPLKRRLIAGR